MSAWLAALPALHFVRPQWLWALLALPLLGWWWRSRQQRASAWRGIVDPHLLPHLLEAGSDRRTHAALATGVLACALAVLALAGPAWRKVEQPLWQTRAPLVIALDLSSAALANDLPPSRLLQARAKLATLLRERKGGQVALVAYAGDAFTVAPLTDDAANVALFLDVLAPDVMPVDGQRADRAIAVSMRLLQQAGADHGDILLLSDHADAAAHAYAASAARAGYRVSALGLGNAAGAPYRDRDGRIGQARLDAGSLRTLADNGNGQYVALTMNAADLRVLGVLDPQQAESGSGSNRGRAGASWQDEGYWLLPPLMLLALFAFRRGGAGMALLVLCIMLPVRAQDVRSTSSQGTPLQGTPWRRPDQVAHARMTQGAEAYRKGDFARAASAYEGLKGADAHYNHGNALAKQGRYEDAIAAYDRALRAKPGMADALANKRAVEAAMKRKPPPGQQGGRGKQDQQQKSQGGQQGRPSEDSRQQSGQPSDGQQPQAATSRDETAQGQSKAPQQPRPPAKPADAKAQQAADAAQRARMQQAMAQAKPGQKPQDPKQAQALKETPAERERRLANEAWLQRVPDDPGGLLRAKFRLEYERRQREGGQ